MHSRQAGTAEYLRLYKISEKKYAIGNFQFGITFHKQQIRSLNIFHELINAGEINLNSGNSKFNIMIVGAGIAGLTFAAAALEAGIQVTLIEKESSYLPVQNECDIRTLHPNIYDWPHPDAYQEGTALPVLNWHASSARNVTRQIEAAFKEIQSRNDSLFKVMFDCEEIKSVERQSNGQFNVVVVTRKVTQIVIPNLIIYALGFGNETISDGASKYFDNDHISNFQKTGNEGSIVIKGNGDGALMDAFRCVVNKFSYDLFFKIMQANRDNYEYLMGYLAEVQNESIESEDPSLYQVEFTKIPNDRLEYIHNILIKQQHYNPRFGDSDFKVIINGKVTEINALNHQRISLLNAFLAHIFMRFRKIEYLPGIMKIDKEGKLKIGRKTVEEIIGSKFKLIERFGTKRFEVFKNAGLSKQELAHIKKYMQPRQETLNDVGFLMPRWSFNEFCKHFKPERNLEFLTDSTINLFTEFADQLNDVIRSKKIDSTFRLAIHRTLCREEKSLYQQITPYVGPDFRKNDTLKQVYDINRGNVGISIKSGMPVLIERKNETDFQHIAAIMNLGFYQKKQKSFFTLPILASSLNQKGQFWVNFVLYIDSYEENFFDKDLLDMISLLIGIFTQKVDRAIFADDSCLGRYNTCLLPQQVDKNFDLTELRKNPCWINVGSFEKQQTLTKYSSLQFF